MNERVLLYGATGYTGREVARKLSKRREGGDQTRIDLVLAGRDARGVRALAEELKLAWRVFPLTDPFQIEAALADVAVVLHAAGPFTATARPMMDACLRQRVHYLDLCGEWPVFLEAGARDAAATQAGIMLMPGVGLSIAASDCLLAHAVERWPDTVRLRLGVSRAEVITRGSIASAARLAGPEVFVRRDGALVGEPAGKLTHAFDFGDGLRETTAVSWADVVTGEFSTGVRDIEVYSELGWPARVGYRASGLAMGLVGAGPWRRAGKALATVWPAGPSDETRREARFVMVVEALDAWRRPRRLRLRTKDGYTVSVLTAAEAVRRVLEGCFLPGFQTPSRVFGCNFVIDVGAAELEPPTMAAGTAA